MHHSSPPTGSYHYTHTPSSHSPLLRHSSQLYHTPLCKSKSKPITTCYLLTNKKFVHFVFFVLLSGVRPFTNANRSSNNIPSLQNRVDKSKPRPTRLISHHIPQISHMSFSIASQTMPSIVRIKMTAKPISKPKINSI